MLNGPAPDVVVVGGGVIGCATRKDLSETKIERDPSLRSYENKRLSCVVAARPGHEMLRRTRVSGQEDRSEQPVAAANALSKAALLSSSRCLRLISGAKRGTLPWLNSRKRSCSNPAIEANPAGMAVAPRPVPR